MIKIRSNHEYKRQRETFVGAFRQITLHIGHVIQDDERAYRKRNNYTYREYTQLINLSKFN